MGWQFVLCYLVHLSLHFHFMLSRNSLNSISVWKNWFLKKRSCNISFELLVHVLFQIQVSPQEWVLLSSSPNSPASVLQQLITIQNYHFQFFFKVSPNSYFFTFVLYYFISPFILCQRSFYQSGHNCQPMSSSRVSVSSCCSQTLPLLILKVCLINGKHRLVQMSCWFKS